MNLFVILYVNNKFGKMTSIDSQEKTMKYKLFGNTGLRVSELALGAMTFGDAWGWGADLNESKSMLDAFKDRGGNFIDSAIIYTNGQSEAILGELLKGQRQEWVLGTKYTLSKDPNNPNAAGNHRKNMVESVHQSLTRLQTDYIDVLWVHAEDEFTPLPEMMRALDDLVRQGKVLYLGISDFPAWKVAQANTLAELKDWEQFAGIQIQYNLIERTAERELLPMAKSLGLSTTVWSPLAGGALTGKYLQQNTGSDAGKRYDVADFGDLLKVNEQRNIGIVETLVKVAQNINHPAHHVALNWLRQRQDQAAIIPIIGAKSMAQLQDSLSFLEFELSTETMAELNQISAIEMGFPHDFLDGVQETVYGAKYALIENHRV